MRTKMPVVMGIFLFILSAFLVCGETIAQQEQETKLIVVGSQGGINEVKDILTMLSDKGVPVTTATDQLEKVKNEKYVLALGGLNESGAAGDFVKEMLTKEEQEESSQLGAEKMYVKKDVFAKGQFIIAFAGPDSEAAADALKHNRSNWLAYVAKWFNIELSNIILYGY